MLQHKLIDFLKSFDRKEMTRFKEFSLSPYFNKHEKVQNLICYLSDIFPHYQAKNCERHFLFKKVFGKDAYDQSKLAVVFTYSVRLVEQFLVQEERKKSSNSYKDQIMLLRQLRQRKKYTAYEKLQRKVEKSLNTQSKRDGWFYEQQFSLATEADHYFTENQRGRNDENLEHRQIYLDLFYMAEKLRDACEIHVRANILKVDFSSNMMDSLIKEIEKNVDKYQTFPAVLIYYRIYKMLKESDVSYYYDALDQLENLSRFFSIEEQKTIYNYYQNYCAQQINKGGYTFLGEIFKLYQLQLKAGLMLEGGFLSEWHYKNIVTVGLLLNETVWVKNFIEEYKETLHPDSVDNAYRFNLASYHYAVKEWDKVLELLVQVEYSDLRYSLGAKVLLLRTYYDLNEYEALHSLTDSFRQYIHRNKLLADARAKSYVELFKMTRKVAQLRSKVDYLDVEKWSKELARIEKSIDEKSIFNKPWLKEKVHELKLEQKIE